MCDLLRRMRQREPNATLIRPGESLQERRRVMDMEVKSGPIVFGQQQARLVLSNDITQRKRAEQALRESEADCGSLPTICRR